MKQGTMVSFEGNPAIVQKVREDGTVDLWVFGDSEVKRVAKVKLPEAKE